MARVSITVNAYTYEIACADGEEQHIQNLAAVLDAKVGELVGAIGQAGESRLLAMAGLLMADDLAEAASANERLSSESARAIDLKVSSSSLDDEELIERLESIADQIENIAKRAEKV